MASPTWPPLSKQHVTYVQAAQLNTLIQDVTPFENSYRTGAKETEAVQDNMKEPARDGWCFMPTWHGQGSPQSSTKFLMSP